MFRHVGGCEWNIGQLFIRVVPKLLANLAQGVHCQVGYEFM